MRILFLSLLRRDYLLVSRHWRRRRWQRTEIRGRPGTRGRRTADRRVAVIDGAGGGRRREGLALVTITRRVVAVRLVADVGAARGRRRRLIDTPVVAIRLVARRVAARATGRAGDRRRTRRRVQRLLGIPTRGASPGGARRACDEVKIALL